MPPSHLVCSLWGQDAMQGSAVLFGAGNIGRGFLAQLFVESGLETVFVDVVDALVDALNEQHGYTLRIVGPESGAIPIDHVRALHEPDRLQVADAIARAEIVATAVGAHALPFVAPALAAGLLARLKTTGLPVNVLLCENLHDAAPALREAVRTHLPVQDQEQVLARTGFVQAVVSRMVPVQPGAEQVVTCLDIRAEAYKRLPVDARAIVGAFPSLVGVEPVDNFAALVERKLYTHNCAHAVLGYMGAAAGYEYGYEALQDVRICALLRAVLDETSQALIRKHGFAPEEQASHVRDLLERFANRELGDTCRRLARDPVRKLAREDRLLGAARLCEEQGIAPRALAWVIAAALRYADPEDPSAPELQRLLQDVGFEVTLRRVCSIMPGETLADLIEEAFQTTQRKEG